MAERSSRSDTRTTIVEAAARLLHEQGPSAVTTRAVAEAAGVQAPALYRLFGDKDGLLQAVAEHVLAEFVSTKAESVRAEAAGGTDPVDDLRAGWRIQVEFGLTHPAVFALLNDPARTDPSPAAQSGWQVLTARVHRIAVAGRLRVTEQRAVQLVHAAGTGVIQTLLAAPVAHRDAGLHEEMLEAVLGRILTDAPATGDDRPRAATVAFRALAPDLPGLSAAERQLLLEWLDRTIDE
ncbi:helix-turn-helix domain-containing protein [Nakamurella sp. A5-74]|uniref:Helix-turn-helix domain-containing protein n=1 Tax=Nakamurella sp. A5-74 TaxID=3158264 RepID=A0AAU8DL88_9ACTN